LSGSIAASGVHTVDGTAIPAGFNGAIIASGGDLILSICKDGADCNATVFSFR